MVKNLMAKILMTTIQVNLVVKRTRIRIFSINLVSQPFLGGHIGLHILFPWELHTFVAWLF